MVATPKTETTKALDAASLSDVMVAACRKTAVMEVELFNARDDIASLSRKLSAAEDAVKDLSIRLASAGDGTGLAAMRKRLPLANVREFGEKLRDMLAALPPVGGYPSAPASHRLNWTLIGNRDTATMISELLLAAAEKLDGHSAANVASEKSAA